MKVFLFDQNRLLVECLDPNMLELIQAHTDADKVRNKMQIVMPVKSGPKLLFYKDKLQLDIDPLAQQAIYKVVLDSNKRLENIKKIKANGTSDNIKFDYNCRGIYEPLKHQKIMFNMAVYSDVSALLADPGTCKTGAYLWAIDHRIQKGQVKKALVITLSSLKENVLAEMELQVPHLKGAVLDGRAQAFNVLQKKYKVQSKNIDYDIYIANYESMFSFVELFPDDYFDMVVLDEAHRIGMPSSRQTKSIVYKFENVKYKLVISGTLISNNLMSFFMPYRFLGPDTVPYANYYEFRRKYMYAVDPDGRIWKPAPGAEAEVKEIVGPIAVMFKKEECIDLPPLIHEKLYCDLEGGQAKIYAEMEKDLISVIDDMCLKCNKKDKCDNVCDDEIKAKSALTLIGKLRQITCGFYINTRTKIDDKGKSVNDSNIITLNENPKLSLLMETISNIPHDRKIIIWSTYVHGVEIISERLGQAFGDNSFLTCYGNQDAFKQVETFKHPGKRFIVANPSKMSAGLNIQFSSYMIFYNNSYSLIQRDQAIGRQYRQGQKDKVTLIDLFARKTIDEPLYQKIIEKKELALNLSELARIIKGKN